MDAFVLATISYGSIRMWLLILRTGNTLYLARQGDLNAAYFLRLAQRRRERVMKAPLLRFSWQAVVAFAAASVFLLAGVLSITVPGPVALALGCVLLSVGAKKLVTGRRALLVDASELRQADWRPPVVIVRSFKDDDLRLRSLMIFNPLRAFARTGTTFEEFISQRLSRIGPVIAISGQADDLFPLGAARYVADEISWRDRVSELFDEARFIVVAVSDTPSLLWEVREALERGHASKLIFIFPPLPLTEAQRRWDALRQSIAADEIRQLQRVAFPCGTRPDGLRALTYQSDRHGNQICVVGDGIGKASLGAALEIAISIAAEGQYKVLSHRTQSQSTHLGSA